MAHDTLIANGEMSELTTSIDTAPIATSQHNKRRKLSDGLRRKQEVADTEDESSDLEPNERLTRKLTFKDGRDGGEHRDNAPMHPDLTSTDDFDVKQHRDEALTYKLRCLFTTCNYNNTKAGNAEKHMMRNHGWTRTCSTGPKKDGLQFRFGFAPAAIAPHGRIMLSHTWAQTMSGTKPSSQDHTRKSLCEMVTTSFNACSLHANTDRYSNGMLKNTWRRYTAGCGNIRSMMADGQIWLLKLNGGTVLLQARLLHKSLSPLQAQTIVSVLTSPLIHGVPQQPFIGISHWIRL